MSVASVSDAPGVSAQHATAQPTAMQLYLREMGRNGERFRDEASAAEAARKVYEGDREAHGESRLRSAHAD